MNVPSKSDKRSEAKGKKGPDNDKDQFVQKLLEKGKSKEDTNTKMQERASAAGFEPAKPLCGPVWVRVAGGNPVCLTYMLEVATPTIDYPTVKTSNDSWIGDVTSVSQFIGILIGPCRLKKLQTVSEAKYPRSNDIHGASGVSFCPSRKE